MPTDPDLRRAFSTFLKPRLPPTWRYIPNQATPNVVTRPTLVYKHLGIEPGTSLGSLSNDIILTLISPLGDDVKAENALDNEVLELCHALRGFTSVTFTGARKVRDDVTKTLGWDISVTASTQRQKKE